MKPKSTSASNFPFDEPWENILVAMIQISLQDLYRKKPKRSHYKKEETYLSVKGQIEKNRKEAKLFFESPHSLFTKYGLSKEYVLSHYEQKLEIARKNKLRTSLRPHKSRKKP